MQHRHAGPGALRRPNLRTLRRPLRALALAAGALAGIAPRQARAQWSTTYDQFYLQAPHNWVFRNQYRGADRLFNAFDYGHAILYETLWTKPDAPASVLEQKEYDYLTKKVLVAPPRVPLEEGAIEIRYAQLAPEAKAMFEWAHILHRQLYDVLADERLSPEQKDAEVARVVAYYKTRPDLAFSSRPKSMKLMQEQPYSLAFRKEYPKFNGLIWAYHWMQVGLYEPLVVHTTAETRQAGARATVARFWQMLGDPPRTFPYQMPMTPAVAPKFAERYPEAAIIFDNLHSMHDVVSDILANDSVPRSRKRAEILRAARLFRDDTSYVMPVEAWLAMARHMGVENMGGPAVGFLQELPTPTVTYGAVMTHDDRTGTMTGFKYGQATGGEQHAGHGAAAAPTDGAAHGGHGTPGRHAMEAPNRSDSGRAGAHTGHRVAPSDSTSSAAAYAGHRAHAAAGGVAHDSAHGAHMIELHQRMLADTVIRDRMLADTAMRRVMGEMVRDTTSGMSPEHRAQMREMMAAPRTTRPSPARRPATSSRPPTARKSAPSRPVDRDPHAGHTAPAKPAPGKPAPRDTSAHHGHHP